MFVLFTVKERRLTESSLFTKKKDYFHSGISLHFWVVIVHYDFGCIATPSFNENT